MKNKKNARFLEAVSLKLTNWMGSPQSLVVHTVLFLGIFLLVPFGLPLDKVMLILTTAVSLEAIYLALFIQMTVNRNTESLEEVEEDIEDIQEDVEGIEDEFEGIQEDVEDLEENVEEITEDLDKIHPVERMSPPPQGTTATPLEKQLFLLRQEIASLRKEILENTTEKP